MDPPNLPDLPVSQMDADSLATLSYIFCDNIAFDRFDPLLLYGRYACAGAR